MQADICHCIFMFYINATLLFEYSIHIDLNLMLCHLTWLHNIIHMYLVICSYSWYMHHSVVASVWGGQGRIFCFVIYSTPYFTAGFYLNVIYLPCNVALYYILYIFDLYIQRLWTKYWLLGIFFTWNWPPWSWPKELYCCFDMLQGGSGHQTCLIRKGKTQLAEDVDFL